MRRPRLKFSRTGIDLVCGVHRGNARGNGRRGRFSVGAVAAIFGGSLGPLAPEQTLVQVGGQLQGAVADLERLVFEMPGIGSRCRTEAHDAIALLMEALERVGRAGVAQERMRGVALGLASQRMVAMA